MSSVKETIRTLRRRNTEAEKVFWNSVKNRRFHGLRFRRQHPIRVEQNGRNWCFIADFYCAESNLVIELDGPIHERQADYDEARDTAIGILGLRVVRIDNASVISDIESVLRLLVTYT